ncbi:prepilin-type N-terminal cleavage/methylation domain-containing protein [uncultured Cetobacterium sp.]|uniref:prepilin-type N-terminal cleavage/methylation domain-containing protein n=1 Tax=uncultured Cetobacterium sp. TaxID=527638 RepID=UPI0026114404|nr:prepilin-type N-terminal cleavage/methylation domain-containing protein [uncultured Cetobacterium sp.]
MKNKGFTFIETMISLIIISILINPIYKNIIFFKKESKNLIFLNLVEDEMEKLRSFYSKNNFNENMQDKNKILVLEKKKVLIRENLYKIVLRIKLKNKIIRESVLYVYE